MKNEMNMDRYKMLSTITCPDCEGSGIVTGTRVEPRCCGRINDDGSCCGYPEPDYQPTPEQCERCRATGIIEKQCCR